MPSERDFVRGLQSRFTVRPPVTTGIGDDGAVLNCSDSQQQIVVTDMLLDQVHFDLRDTSARLAGRKAVAVNLSDLAAMACRPTAAFVSIAIPRSLADPSQFLSELYAGIADLADQFEFTVAGGDTNTWDGPFAINVCLTGVPCGALPVLRSGAQVGDVLLVSGALGGSLASGRHLTFEPRLKLAAWLVENLQVHAMLDISDGLAIDLHRMLEASEVGAVVQTRCVPVHSDLMAETASTDHSQLLHRALSDGEDFELLLAVPEDSLQAISDSLSLQTLGLQRIGAITNQPGQLQLCWPDGIITNQAETGWQHRC